jgi:D-alanyl-D-alanine carboxypeptidase (penicillin-binding protein 5/6)
LFLDPTVDGLKTGHTDAAGWCLISTVNRPPRKLLTVVLGAPNDAARIAESRNLIEWAFSAFEGKRIFEAKKPIATLRVWKSDVSAIPVGFNDDVTAVADAGKISDLTTDLKLDERKMAPILAGDKVGTLVVKRAGSVVYERDVVAMEPALSGSIWKRAWHSVVLWWKGLF